MVHLYASDFNDATINPFDAENQTRWRVDWCVYLEPYANNIDLETGTGWNFGDPTRASEGYGLFWASLVANEIHTGDTSTDYLTSPADYWTIRSQREFIANAGGNQTNAMFPCSFYYSPTMWLSADRYAGTAAVPLATRGGERLWRRNRLGEVIYPSAKVMVWERMDFRQDSRLSRINQPEPFPPQWNNPAAKVYAMTTDGSVVKVETSELIELANAPDAATRDIFRPSGTFDVRSSTMVAWELTEDGFEHNRAGFFWATRHGIRGRDIPR
jgi:hypothetical protein